MSREKSLLIIFFYYLNIYHIYDNEKIIKLRRLILMIKITDNNRQELIEKCLAEAAKTLNISQDINLDILIDEQL